MTTEFKICAYCFEEKPANIRFHTNHDHGDICGKCFRLIGAGQTDGLTVDQKYAERVSYVIAQTKRRVPAPGEAVRTYDEINGKFSDLCEMGIPTVKHLTRMGDVLDFYAERVERDREQADIDARTRADWRRIERQRILKDGAYFTAMDLFDDLSRMYERGLVTVADWRAERRKWSTCAHPLCLNVYRSSHRQKRYCSASHREDLRNRKKNLRKTGTYLNKYEYTATLSAVSERTRKKYEVTSEGIFEFVGNDGFSGGELSKRDKRREVKSVESRNREIAEEKKRQDHGEVVSYIGDVSSIYDVYTDYQIQAAKKAAKEHKKSFYLSR
ncbi:hypothetical protein ACTWQL_13755 [Pseudalkalibacillus sp. R45]|uniref:hypothetical protein n=1 Tax=Pseudalkalibacillus sp. R45 TaxID=3457433 RepID=UPI003FCC61D8